jgi:hypothetical protein
LGVDKVRNFCSKILMSRIWPLFFL